jgi:diketogulonate reductase-like aldo/keto reductase
MAEGRPREAELAALRAGIARGLSHIDTAELYGSGAAEELVAEAIRGVPRRDLFLVSKVLPQNATHAGTIFACEQSLRRLGVDQGKIRALGVSNFDVDDLEEARALLVRHPIVCNQVLYHLQERHIDVALRDYCARRHIALVGHSPFGHGRFPSLASPSGRVLTAIAARHGATPRQVALAFLTREAPLFTIPKASTAAHTEENAGALGLTLTGPELAEIDAAFPVRPSAELPAI